MAAADEWSVVFCVDASGTSPVEAFLARLDQRTQVRFAWSIEQLRLRNIQAREPLVRHLEGKLWELRRESDTNIYRLLCVFLSGRRILFLHGFHKKTQKTPRRELETVLRRLQDFIERGGGA